MTKEHPITPPPELVTQWFLGAKAMPVDQWVTDVATQAARWGSDQELEACCEWLDGGFGDVGNFPATLRAARRPKPPSLKEQALAVLENEPEADDMKDLVVFDVDQVELIRRALEALDD